MKQSTMTKDYEAQELCFLKKRNADSASLLRPLFLPAVTSYNVSSRKYSKSLAENQQRNNLQVLSEPKPTCQGQASVFLLKEGDEQCEPIHDSQFQKNNGCQKRSESVRQYSTSSRVVLSRLLKLLNHLTRYGALSAIGLSLSFQIFCSNAIAQESIGTGNAVSFNSYNCVKALIGEVEGESFLTKLATAECLRNRGTLKGVYGINSKRIAKASDKVKADCLRAWTESSRTNLVKGATVWGNASDVKIFKKSKWFKSFKQTAHIGNHYFFKEVRKCA